MGKSGSFFLYPEIDPDHLKNLIQSKLDQDLSSEFSFMKF